MDVSDIIDGLNEPQRMAVSAPAQHLLVQAGAGSGKTRVLTHRLAWLTRVEGVSPFSILAVTFTNKAASEMRSRVENLLGMPTGPMWIGTFHGIAHRLLRAHWKEAGLVQAFQILDSDDQLRIVKRVIRGMELDESQYPPKQLMWFINGHKDEGRRPRHIDTAGDVIEEQYVKIYEGYEAARLRAGAVDFAELLLKALEILRDNDSLLEHYQRRFQHILVDEFQDTNTIQYAWLRLLSAEKTCLFAVGDDDQSIYGWRGARIENILNFDKDFPDATLIRLEQNYRSTGNILAAANALIEFNGARIGKNLWTSDSEGDLITLYNAYNEMDEARFVVETISNEVDKGEINCRECAILYRSNAQSRVIEQALRSVNMNYRVYGGMRFFERAEIKDALGYLRLVSNVHDDVAFERVINLPTRGIGERTLSQVRDAARINDITLWKAAHELVDAGILKGRAATAIKGFFDLIDQLRENTAENGLVMLTEYVLKNSGVIEHHKKDKSEKGKSRIENLEELVSAAQAHQITTSMNDEMSPLESFLADAALDAGDTQNTDGDAVQLMTMHSAKGLEFPLVFITGMEQGLFPSQRAVEEDGRLDEERRLCYVGITRAEQKLYLTLAEQRRLYGRETQNLPSKFIGEIPANLLQEIRPRMQVTRPVYQPIKQASITDDSGEEALYIGQQVSHGKFGYGVVLCCEGQGSHARVQVNFEDSGSKWLVLAYAKLEPVD